MITVLPGESILAKRSDDVYCILGSCVGILILYKDTIGITHGRNKLETANLITDILTKFEKYDKIVLLGGMEGYIGKSNIAAAKEALANHIYEDRSGERCVITIRDNKVRIK